MTSVPPVQPVHPGKSRDLIISDTLTPNTLFEIDRDVLTYSEEKVDNIVKKKHKIANADEQRQNIIADNIIDDINTVAFNQLRATERRGRETQVAIEKTTSRNEETLFRDFNSKIKDFTRSANTDLQVDIADLHLCVSKNMGSCGHDNIINECKIKNDIKDYNDNVSELVKDVHLSQVEAFDKGKFLAAKAFGYLELQAVQNKSKIELEELKMQMELERDECCMSKCISDKIIKSNSVKSCKIRDLEKDKLTDQLRSRGRNTLYFELYNKY